MSRWGRPSGVCFLNTPVRPFQSSDLYLVEILAKYIQFSLGQVRTSENEKICTLDIILGKLLDHQLVDDYVFNRTDVYKRQVLYNP